MASMTDYTANKVRDHALRNIAWTSPTTVYLALFTTATAEDGSGTEVTGGSYARQAITFNGTDPGLAIQAALVTFSGMPACTVVAAAIMDASSGGNMLFHGKLPRARAVSAGQEFPIQSGDLKILID